MKRSIQWHEDCLANSEAYTERHEAELRRMIGQLETQIAKYRSDNSKRREQIEAAKAAGLDEFDADKFKVKRVKKVSAQ